MPDRPLNILWIQTDHHVWSHHHELPGAYPISPTYARIAARGVAFDRAYTVCPLCTPARASTLTGKLPHRHGLHSNGHKVPGPLGNNGALKEFRPAERLISHYLGEAGYRCGYFGKWHCGEERGPRDYGFEGWAPLSYGYPFGEDAYREYLERQGLSDPVATIEWSERADYPRGMRLALCDTEDWFAYGGGLARLETPAETHEAYFVADLAARWIRGASGGDQPWFIRVDPWGPHPPYVLDHGSYGSIDHRALPPYPNLLSDLPGRPDHHRRYFEHWSEQTGFGPDDWRFMRARAYEHAQLVDQAMGGLVDLLEELNLLDSTAIFYTTDHGDIIGTNGGASNKGPIMVEENVRIPLAMSVPGGGTGGTRENLVTNMDLFATTLELAGVHGPDDVESRSVVPLYRNPEARWEEEILLEHHGMRTPQFQRTLVSGNLKYTVQIDGFEELYDLGEDPWEMNNLMNEPSRTRDLDKCRSGIKTLMTDTGDSSSDAEALLSHLEATR